MFWCEIEGEEMVKEDHSLIDPIDPDYKDNTTVDNNNKLCYRTGNNIYNGDKDNKKGATGEYTTHEGASLKNLTKVHAKV